VNCPLCGSQRATNVYCWHCGKPLPPFDIGTFLKSVKRGKRGLGGKGATIMLGASKGRRKSR